MVDLISRLFPVRGLEYRREIPMWAIRLMQKKDLTIPDIVRPSVIRPVFTRIGIVEVRKPGDIARHQHTNYEIIFVDRGVYGCRHNDVEVKLARNELLIVKPGDWHHDFFGKGYLRYLVIGFNLQVAPGMPVSIFREGTSVERQNFAVQRRDFMPFFERIHGETLIGDFFSAHIQDAVVLEFFYRMIRAIPREILSENFVATSEEAAFSANLFSVIHSRLTQKLSVEKIAEAMGMSASSLAHKCQELLHSSPARLFLRTKMNRAFQMLKETDMSVKEVSAYLGFEDPAHFTRAFKEAFKRAPSELKDQPDQEPPL